MMIPFRIVSEEKHISTEEKQRIIDRLESDLETYFANGGKVTKVKSTYKERLYLPAATVNTI